MKQRDVAVAVYATLVAAGKDAHEAWDMAEELSDVEFGDGDLDPEPADMPEDDEPAETTIESAERLAQGVVDAAMAVSCSARNEIRQEQDRAQYARDEMLRAYEKLVEQKRLGEPLRIVRELLKWSRRRAKLRRQADQQAREFWADFVTRALQPLAVAVGMKYGAEMPPSAPPASAVVDAAILSDERIEEWRAAVLHAVNGLNDGALAMIRGAISSVVFNNGPMPSTDAIAAFIAGTFGDEQLARVISLTQLAWKRPEKAT